MKTFELVGELRTEVGKTACKKIRNAGQMPCVLYGGKENVNFKVDTASLKKLIYTPKVHLVDLTIGNNKHQAILKDLQFHAVTDEISHLDFLEISSDKPVEISVPVVLSGVSPGVRAGGKLHLINRKLKIKALSKYLPDDLNVDISDLNLGKSIRVADLSFENITILNAKNTVVASVKLTRASKGTEEAAGGAAPTEGAPAAEQKKAE